MATDPGPFGFQLLAVDPRCAARRGQFRTPHGSVATPAFMPVGTQGTVKGLTIAQLRETGAQMILGNAYHLALRPGDEVVRDLGGLHRFSGWNGPILTDSGGFQIFSLANQVRVTESGATFRSHLDGALLELTPERAVAIQENLGSDVAMVLDHVVRLPADPSVVRDACERSIRWAERCQAVARRPEQILFAIVQGGLDLDLRVHCAQELRRLNFPGYAIGGLSVGESETEMHAVLDQVAPVLPTDRPRYLMGVGRPIDLLEGIRRGIDLFDCVMPTRNGRNALAFTDHGPIRLRNAVHQRDERPLESDCPCPACRHSRGYLRHLFIAGEMLGPILLTAHNLTFYQRLMQRAQQAIEKGEFLSLLAECRRAWS